MEKVIIFGGSGFLGTLLQKKFVAEGFSVVVVDCVPPKKQDGVSFVFADTTYPLTKNDALRKPYAVINLIGKNIASRFTKKHMQEIYTTRIISTRNIVRLFEDPEYRPSVYIHASAIGYYGNQGDILLDEKSDAGSTFLSTVVVDWEHEARVAEHYGVRTVILRQGNVLGRGGFMAKVVPLYTKWLGGPLGTGNFWFSWIHSDDLIRLYAHVLQEKRMHGVFNAVAHPILYKDFSRILAQSLHVPHIFSTPIWALRFLYGDFADEITSSTKVISHRLSHYGFSFHFHDCSHALWDIKKMKR